MSALGGDDRLPVADLSHSQELQNNPKVPLPQSERRPPTTLRQGYG